MIFLNSASSALALVFYLPGVCTHTDTKGKQSPEFSKIFGKNTIFNEHPVFKNMLAFPSWSDNLNSEFDFGSTPVDILLDWLLFLQKTWDI